MHRSAVRILAIVALRCFHASLGEEKWRVHVFYESVIFFLSVYKDSNKELLYQIILLNRQSMSHHAMHKYLKQTLQTLQILEILKISVICMRIRSNRATDYYVKSIWCTLVLPVN